MPDPAILPRQESTVGITRPPNLVGFNAPLRQKPFTTLYLLSFHHMSLKFLQLLDKTPNSTDLNYSIIRPQLPDSRRYVLNFRCTLVRYPAPSLLCRTAPTDGSLFILPFFGSHILRHTFILTLFCFLQPLYLAHFWPLKSDISTSYPRTQGCVVYLPIVQIHAA